MEREADTELVPVVLLFALFVVVDISSFPPASRQPKSPHKPSPKIMSSFKTEMDAEPRAQLKPKVTDVLAPNPWTTGSEAKSS